MGDQEMSTSGVPGQSSNPADPKGKGKAIDPQPHDMSMDEDDDESGEEEEVSPTPADLRAARRITRS